MTPPRIADVVSICDAFFKGQTIRDKGEGSKDGWIGEDGDGVSMDKVDLAVSALVSDVQSQRARYDFDAYCAIWSIVVELWVSSPICQFLAEHIDFGVTIRIDAPSLASHLPVAVKRKTR